jgi:HAE1 family hydrophobic/amphiphilic exporter-1
MIQPIGLTVTGGLISSTFMTLFFIPVLYSLINEHRGKQERIVQGRAPEPGEEKSLQGAA